MGLDIGRLFNKLDHGPAIGTMERLPPGSNHKTYKKIGETFDGFECSRYDVLVGPDNNKWESNVKHNVTITVSEHRRRRQRWSCGGTWQYFDCNGGNCVKLFYNDRRRYR